MLRRKLFEEGDIPSTQEGKNIALINECNLDNHVVVSQLLAAGADVHVDNDEPLMIASKNGSNKLIKILLEAGADPKAHHSRALVRAVQGQHKEIVRILLERGANPNAKDRNSDKTVLQIAVEQRCISLVVLLLRAGADPKPFYISDRYKQSRLSRSGSKRVNNHSQEEKLIQYYFIFGCTAEYFSENYVKYAKESWREISFGRRLETGSELVNARIANPGLALYFRQLVFSDLGTLNWRPVTNLSFYIEIFSAYGKRESEKTHLEIIMPWVFTCAILRQVLRLLIGHDLPISGDKNKETQDLSMTLLGIMDEPIKLDKTDERLSLLAEINALPPAEHKKKTYERQLLWNTCLKLNLFSHVRASPKQNLQQAATKSSTKVEEASNSSKHKSRRRDQTG